MSEEVLFQIGQEIRAFRTGNPEMNVSLAHSNPFRNGDVIGGIPRTNVEDILFIDVVSLLKRDGFPAAAG